MKEIKKKFSIVFNFTEDEVYGPIATSINGEVGSLLYTSVTDGVKYHNAIFPYFGAVANIPDSFVTISEIVASSDIK